VKRKFDCDFGVRGIPIETTAESQVGLFIEIRVGFSSQQQPPVGRQGTAPAVQLLSFSGIYNSLAMPLYSLYWRVCWAGGRYDPKGYLIA